MGSSENTNSEHSANQIVESFMPDLANFCVSTLTDYLDGLTTEDRFETERHLCLKLIGKWTDAEQVNIVEHLLERMNFHQLDQIDDRLNLLLKRDFITLLAKAGMDHIAEKILSYLDADSLAVTELVCKKWLCVISNSTLWKRLCKQKVYSDPLWLDLFKHRGWIQYLSKPLDDTKSKPHLFYRTLYPKILKEIENLDYNWRNGRHTIERITCNSTHSRGVYCLQYDHEKIVSGLRDNTIKIWNRKNLQCVQTMIGHTGSVLCLQYNDKIIITGSSDSTIRVWDINDGTMLNTYTHHSEAVLHLRFDNDMMVTCSKDQMIAVWELSATNELSLRRMLMGHRAAVNVVDFDNKYIVSASGDRTIKVWNTSDCEFVKTLRGHERGIACLQYRDSLIVSGSSDRTIRVWNIETFECVRILSGHTDLVRCLRFDTKRIVSGAYDGKIMVWDLVAALDPQNIGNNNICLATMEEHTGKLFRLQFDEFQIVSSSHDDTIIIWNYLNSTPANRYSERENVEEANDEPANVEPANTEAASAEVANVEAINAGGSNAEAANERVRLDSPEVPQPGTFIVMSSSSKAQPSSES